jgi:sugar lactone lactonase YvrE
MKIRYLWSATLLIFSSLADAEAKLYQASDLTPEHGFTTGVEGPAVDENGRLYAVNFGKQGTIGVIDKQGNAKHWINLPEGSIGNGIRFDQNGFMYIADYTQHNVLRIDPLSKEIKVYAHSKDMNQPNDIAISRSGNLYASDPNWTKGTGNLWLIKTNGEVVLLESDMGTTNGVEVSANDNKLYVNESVQRNIWVYDILDDGQVSNKRLFYHFDEHGMDGMRVDEKGNLYVARYGAGQVAMLSKKGKLKRNIDLKGKFPTNVAFGGPTGKTLYVTMQKRGMLERFTVRHTGRSVRLINYDPQ